jgi:subtilase family serine protease
MMRGRNSSQSTRRRPASVDRLETRQLLSAIPKAPSPIPQSDRAVTITATPSAARSETLVNSTIPISGTAAAGAFVGPVIRSTLTAAVPTDILQGATAVPGSADSGAIPAGGGGTPAVSPFTPQEIQEFYGINNITFDTGSGSITGNGAGQTIAIIDAYDSPNLLDTTDPNYATSDLAIFDQQFGLPDPPSFLKISESVGTPLPTQTSPTSWGLESCLDVEWVHALAPMANIVLVEANSGYLSDLISAAAVTAGAYPGVSVVSMSFLQGESGSETSYDSDFLAPGVTYLAATGDQGSASTGYPSLSPNVVAVGGTSITTSDAAGDYASETVWNNTKGATGGAPSTVEARPSYQSGLTIAGTTRTTPDVSFDGDPLTGAYVYDSTYNTASSGWFRVGGTSLSTPCWAALIAIADQGRAEISLPSMSGPSVTLPRLYGLPSSDFNDITSGNNEVYTAAPGYDLASGIGTPVANLLVPDLAGGATITGRMYYDNNGDGVFDAGDNVQSAQPVYIDLNNSGVYNASDPVAYTNQYGIYTFTDQPGHESGTVRLKNPQSGYIVDTSSQAVATAFGATDTIDFPLYRTTQGTSGAGDAFTLQLDPTGTQSQIYYDGNLVDSAPFTLAATLTFDLQAAGDSLTIDATNGNPIPTGGLSLIGTAGASDTLTIVGGIANDSYNVTSGAVVFSGRTITQSNVSSLSLNPGIGTNSILVASGAATVTAAAAGGGILPRTFSSISIGATGLLAVATAASHGDRTLVLTSGLSIIPGGRFDLGGNDMVLQAGGASGFSTLNALAGTGDAMGAWTGAGLDSSAAAANPAHLTALGIAPAAVFGTARPFDNYTPAPTDVLVKYTWYGDANLDGKVDGSDYTRVDFAASVAGYTGWANGDFNYDSMIDGSDYSLIDNAYNNQTGRM